MRKRAWVYAALSGLVVLCGGGAAVAQEMTQEQALERFERESPQLRALAGRIAVTRAETRGWGLLPNPAAAFSREDAAGAKDDFFTVQQSLPLNGRLGLQRSAGRAQVSSIEAAVAYERALLRSEFRSAFYALLLAEQRVAVGEAWRARLQDIVRILQERQQAGEGSVFDRMRGERELADAAANVASQQAVAAQERARLASFLAPGTDATTLRVRGDFAQAGPLPTLPEVLARAGAARGDYVSGERQLERLALERRAAGRLAIPDPVVTAGLKSSTAPGRSGNGYIVSVTVPLAVFNHGQTEQDRLQAAEVRTQAEQAARRQQIESGVHAAYEVVRLRRQAAADYARALGDSGAEMARAAQVAYEEGDRGILELLDANRVAMQSGLQALELSWLSKQAEIELNRSVGEELLP